MAKAPSATVRKRKPAAKAEAIADEPLTFDDDGIKRVQDIIRNARATWFALLGALVFASVTLASVKDISFFVNTVETKLPVVGISVPVVSFFWAGSLLIAALYAYFHLYLELLWQALGDFPARDKSGAPLADRIEPWIVADTALRFRDWLRGDTGEKSASRKRAMPWISGFVSLGLVWVFGLAVIFWFWWRSMPAHEPVLTLFLGAVLWVTVFVFGSSLAGAWTHLKFENHEAQRPVYWQWSVPVVFVAIVGATLVRTGKEPIYWEYEAEENPLLFGETVCGWQIATTQKPSAAPDTKSASAPAEIAARKPPPKLPCWRRSDLFTRILLPAHANLREAVFTEKPKDWQRKEIAETEFRLRWCKERGEPKCANPLALANRVFADKKEEEAFQKAWKARWAAQLKNFPKPDMRGRDLRSANMSLAQLEGVDFSGASLDDAVLTGSRLDGARLSIASLDHAQLPSANLDGANLSQARLRGADLSDASLDHADLDGARLEGAIFSRANLEGANLLFAHFDRSHLDGARLDGANLSATNLFRAHLHGASLISTYLFGTILDHADLSNAVIDVSYFSEIDMKGANLELTMLSGSAEKSLDFDDVDLSEVNFHASALRFVAFGGTNVTKLRNFSSSFGDASVSLPRGLEPPCQWGASVLTDAEYFGRWKGWLDSIRSFTVGLDFHNYPPIPPPPGCVLPPAEP